VAENFISAVINHTERNESPTSFWKWSSFSTISSVMRDRCYLKFGDSFLFPNLYIMLLAESSGHRKNAPVELSQGLVTNIAGIKSIAGRASVEGILDELAVAETDNFGKLVKCNSATFFSTELSAGIVNNVEGIKILTDIYDYKPTPYQHRLRTGPKFDLTRVVFSMFSASNEKMLQGFFNDAIIGGGFIARTLLIMPDEFREPNSLLRVDHDARKESKDRVVQHLKKVAQVTGEFGFIEEAITEYESWYSPFRKEYNKRKETTGFIGRVHTHVLKLSMILAANDLTKCIQKRHIEQAIEECLSLIKNYSMFTMSNAKTDLGSVGGVIVLELAAAKDNMLARKSIVRAHWQNLDITLLDKARDALVEAGMLQIHMMKEGEYWKLTQTALEMLK